jgi:hypothetical protein
MRSPTKKSVVAAAVLAIGMLAAARASARDVELQPLAAHAVRVAESLQMLGAPLPADEQRAIERAGSEKDVATGITEITRILDARCLAVVTVNPESRVKAERGPAATDLVEAGWRTFLVKVVNEAGVTAALNVTSPQGLPLAGSAEQDVRDRWLEIASLTSQPMQKNLSGLGVEYRVVSLYSRDAGRREAKLRFDVGPATQDLGFRGEVDVLFAAAASTELKLGVRDERGEPTTAAFEIRDGAGHVYPSQAKRLAPDFSFHSQVYRADGESVRLPPGKYNVKVTRGPEYWPIERAIEVGAGGAKQAERFDLKRWVDPAATGWYSGDHHIHAAGCAHYSKPTEGVHAADMIRHTIGEDLKVGCNLTWGPCFDYQKQFFTGGVDKVSQFPYLLRYDIEVSGFGSHQSGHLCLLRLKDQMYPGGDSWKHWPTLGLNTLRWAKRQGAVCGPAHSGWGLEVKSTDLPNYEIPPYSGIGANEYVVDVTHEVPGPDGKPTPAVDFMSLVDTPSRWELNMWYHTLNCGYRTRGSGETDFPCIYGERVGLGRSYVKLDGKLDFDAWCEGIRNGRSYVSDGMSHLLDFRVNDAAVGVNGSELRLEAGGTVRVTAKVAALLDETPDDAIRSRPLDQKPFWHLERARVERTREVPVEVIVNGRSVATQKVAADGQTRDLSFDVKLDRSSWVAVRILPSSHTNPVFVLVGGKPIRASKQSAEWCLKGVDVCWGQKKRFIAANEMKDAEAAYDHARQAYRRIVGESE